MTRKCALCKETNYKNNYSFFSAPKDPEIRKKWQIVLGITNHAITDDIYVCSRHFHKNDIITHWVSGVPPQVIKIKYKKCRLRPGAIPVSRRKKNLNDDECMDNANVCYQTYSKLQDCMYNVDENVEYSNTRLSEDIGKIDVNISMQNLEAKKPKSKRNESNKTLGSSDSCSVEPNTESVDTNREENRIPNKQFHADILSKTTESMKKYDSFKEDRMSLEIWKHNVISTDPEEFVDNNLKITDNLYINNQVLAALNYDNLNMQDKVVYDVSKNEILFEDFLEICTEVSVPRGWSCLVTSKGHSTTVVYLFMGITKDGFPFVEKQIFIRSDMVLHCAVANREIDPFVHDLVKEDKHIKIKSLLDIEELVDEFDHRVVCQGICDEKDYENVDMTKNVYKDGIKWRHTLCPLIVKNNLSRCTKCSVLFHTVVRKSNRIYETEAKKYMRYSKFKNI